MSDPLTAHFANLAVPEAAAARRAEISRIRANISLALRLDSMPKARRDAIWERIGKTSEGDILALGKRMSQGGSRAVGLIEEMFVQAEAVAPAPTAKRPSAAPVHKAATVPLPIVTTERPMPKSKSRPSGASAERNNDPDENLDFILAMGLPGFRKPTAEECERFLAKHPADASAADVVQLCQAMGLPGYREPTADERTAIDRKFGEVNAGKDVVRIVQGLGLPGFKAEPQA